MTPKRADDSAVMPGAEIPVDVCPLCECGLNEKSSRALYGIPICTRCSSAFVRRRIGAYVIDDVIWWCVAVFSTAMIGNVLSSASSPQINQFIDFFMPIYVLVFLPVLFTFKDGFEGLSLGKAMLGIRVLDWHTCQPIGFRMSFIRNITLLVPFVPILVLFELRKGRRGGDLWAGTFVIWERYQDCKPFDLRGVLCTHCSYDLTGNTSGRCPECGAEIPLKTKPVHTTPQ